MIGATDSLIPALDALGAFLFRDGRAEHTVHRPVAGDVLGGLPVAYGEAGQIGRAQRRRFHAAGALDFEVADVGHGLHEVVVGRRAAVHPERLHGDAGVRRHGAEDVVDLIADAVQRGADDVVLVAAPGEAHDGAAGVLVPVGRAEAGEGRHDVTAVGVLDLLGHILGVAGLFQQAQLIAEPLDGRTGHENRAFQRIIHLAVGAAGDGGDKAVPGCDRRLTGVHEQKAAGSEGVFRLAGGKAGLAEEGRLLVACRTGNFYLAAEVHRVSVLIKAAGRHRLREHTFRDVQLLQDLVVPFQRVDVEHHGAAGVGIVGDVQFSAGQLPDEPGLHGAEEQFSPLGPFAGAGDMIQYPLELSGRKIGVDDEAGLLPEFLRQAPGFQLVAVFAGAAALPDDGVADGLPGLLVPDDGGLPLVGDADGGDVLGSGADFVHGREGHAQLGGPDLIGVVLHPAGSRVILGKFLLRDAADLTRFVEQDTAVRGGSGVQRHDVRHRLFSPFPALVL